MNPLATQIAEYTTTAFTAETREVHSISHDIHCRGAGPPVLLIQELPGFRQKILALADRLIDTGFEVIMPHLFGLLGTTSIGAKLLRVICLRKEFRFLSSHKSSPIVD